LIRTDAMETLTAVDAVRSRVQQWRAAGLRIAFVPTMGNLHAGHMSLLAAARYRGDRVVASIFVNPLQFGPSEDYSGYPRTLDEDQQLLQEARCDLLFAPSVADMYPHGGDQRTLIVVRGLSDILDGRFRPGHFDGVATVVAKLFGIVVPDVAVFGEKDYQQLKVVTQLARDLDLKTRIVGAPTVRAPDGLALSSRNRYLNADERARAALIHRSLSQAVRAIYGGSIEHAQLEREGSLMLEGAGMSVDYFAIRNATDLSAASAASSDLVILTAVRLGRARLIDNLRTHRP